MVAVSERPALKNLASEIFSPLVRPFLCAVINRGLINGNRREIPSSLHLPTLASAIFPRRYESRLEKWEAAGTLARALSCTACALAGLHRQREAGILPPQAANLKMWHGISRTGTMSLSEKRVWQQYNLTSVVLYVATGLIKQLVKR